MEATPNHKVTKQTLFLDSKNSHTLKQTPTSLSNQPPLIPPCNSRIFYSHLAITDLYYFENVPRKALSFNLLLFLSSDTELRTILFLLLNLASGGDSTHC